MSFLSCSEISPLFFAISRKVLIMFSSIVTPKGKIVELEKPLFCLLSIKGAVLLSGNLKCLIFLQVKSVTGLS